MNATDTLIATYECRHVDPDYGTCMVFPYDTATDRDDHEASAAHVFPHMWSVVVDARVAGPSIDAPESNPDAEGGRSRQSVTIGWSKVGDVWCVRVPNGGGKTGDTVTFPKRNGGESTVTLGEIVQDDATSAWFAPAASEAPKVATDGPERTNRHPGPCADCGGNVDAETGSLAKEDGRWIVRHFPTCPERSETPATTTTAVEAEPGSVYMTATGDIVRVQSSKVGRLYGKMWDGTGWEYCAGCIRELDHKLTAEEAAAFGHATDHCVFCSRALEDKRSTEVGYGPTCAGKHGLPWG